jgi:hypothetical protein
VSESERDGCKGLSLRVPAIQQPTPVAGGTSGERGSIEVGLTLIAQVSLPKEGEAKQVSRWGLFAGEYEDPVKIYHWVRAHWHPISLFSACSRSMRLHLIKQPTSLFFVLPDNNWPVESH